MDKRHADTVRLLLGAIPEVFAGDVFALRGGTAINLFGRDVPRLSVDIDGACLPWQGPREQALRAIARKPGALAGRIAALGLHTRLARGKEQSSVKLVVWNSVSQVKVEVNTLFRSKRTARRAPFFEPGGKRSVRSRVCRADAGIPTELYAGKLVAALDRQHPRDLSNVWRLFERGGITDAMAARRCVSIIAAVTVFAAIQPQPSCV